MTFDEYVIRATHHYTEVIVDGTLNYRLGQAYMNVLHNVRYELSEEITGTTLDCFYNDSLIGPFLISVEERWEK